MRLSPMMAVCLLPSAAALSLVATPRGRTQPQLQLQLRMSAGDVEADRTELYASPMRKVAVSGLQPKSKEGQEYVSVPPPEAPMPPSLVQRAKGPFMGVTLLAVSAIAAWQSNKAYRSRTQALLEEFGATMVFHRGDVQEMSTAVKQFRKQLGPGSFKAPMFEAFVTALATDVPIGVGAISTLKQVAQMMRLSDAVAATCLEGSAAALQSQPSVLGKLTFIAERALPQSASMAKLRSRFPNWSLDTVTALQRAMLENLYRDTYCDGSETADSAALAMLGLSEADAARLQQEVAEKKAEAEREAAEKAAEEERAQQLQDALVRASEMKQMKTIVTSPELDEADDDAPEPSVTSASGTHEYECTKCGYMLFPAAGREHKFFGAGFSCPQCGAGKEEFVDNGLADVEV